MEEKVDMFSETEDEREVGETDFSLQKVMVCLCFGGGSVDGHGDS